MCRDCCLTKRAQVLSTDVNTCPFTTTDTFHNFVFRYVKYLKKYVSTTTADFNFIPTSACVIDPPEETLFAAIQNKS